MDLALWDVRAKDDPQATQDAKEVVLVSLALNSPQAELALWDVKAKGALQVSLDVKEVAAVEGELPEMGTYDLAIARGYSTPPYS